MTVSSLRTSSDPITVVVTGIVTYGFDFQVQEAESVRIRVTALDESGEAVGEPDVLVFRTDYTVMLSDAPSIGGSVRVSKSLTVGSQVVIYRSTRNVQATSLPNHGPFFAKTIEKALDHQTLVSQEIMDGSISITEGSGLTPTQAEEISANTAKRSFPQEAEDTIAENTEARHQHSNKTILDNVGVTDGSTPKLTYNGNTVDTVIAQRDVFDGLTSNDTSVSLSARQGLILRSLLDANRSFPQSEQDAIAANTAKRTFSQESEEKLDGIEVGAQENVQSDWLATEGKRVILNKPANSSHPTDLVLPDDLQELQKNLVVADTVLNTTTLTAQQTRLDANGLPTGDAGTIGFFDNRGLGNGNLDTDPDNAGLLDPDNAKIFMITRDRVEMNFEPLSLTGGIEIDGTAYNLTKHNDGLSAVYLDAQVTYYRIVGFGGGFVGGIEYEIKLKKADGDYLTFGDVETLTFSDKIRVNLADGSVGTDELADGSVTAAKLANGVNLADAAQSGSIKLDLLKLTIVSGISNPNSYFSSGYVLPSMDNDALLGITVIGVSGDHNTHIFRYGELPAQSRNVTGGTPILINSIHFSIGDVQDSETSAPLTFFISRNAAGEVLYTTSAAVTGGVNIYLSKLIGPAGDKGDKGDAGSDNFTPAIADAIASNTAKNSYPEADQTKLITVTRGANPNVNADWLATEGDAVILNKPVIPAGGDGTGGGGGTSASAPVKLNTLNTFVRPNGFSVPDSFISSGYVLPSMDADALLGLTIVGVNGDHDIKIFRYSDISELSSSVGDVPTSTNAAQFGFGNPTSDSVIGITAYISTQTNGTVLYTLANMVTSRLTLILSNVIGSVVGGSNDLEPILPEDLEVLSENVTLEDIGDRTTTMTAAAISGQGVGFFNRRGIASDDTNPTANAGALSVDNDKIFQITQTRIETNHERLSLTDGITIDGTAHDLTETQVVSNVTSKTVRVYTIAGFADFVAGTDYTIKLKKSDGDFMIFGPATKIVLDDVVEANYNSLRNKPPASDFDDTIDLSASRRYVYLHEQDTTPDNFTVFLVCKVANSGYAVGDRIPLGSDMRTGNEGVMVSSGPTDITVVFGFDGYIILRRDRSTQSDSFSVFGTPTDWSLRFLGRP